MHCLLLCVFLLLLLCKRLLSASFIFVLASSLGRTETCFQGDNLKVEMVSHFYVENQACVERLDGLVNHSSAVSTSFILIFAVHVVTAQTVSPDMEQV